MANVPSFQQVSWKSVELFSIGGGHCCTGHGLVEVMVKRQPTMTVGSKQGIKRPVYCRTFPYFLRYLTQYITEGLSSTISRSRLHRDHQPTLSIQQSKGHTTSHNGARWELRTDELFDIAPLLDRLCGVVSNLTFSFLAVSNFLKPPSAERKVHHCKLFKWSGRTALTTGNDRSLIHWPQQTLIHWHQLREKSLLLPATLSITLNADNRILFAPHVLVL